MQKHMKTIKYTDYNRPTMNTFKSKELILKKPKLAYQGDLRKLL